jgi:YVTN family beta-propeller protein
VLLGLVLATCGGVAFGLAGPGDHPGPRPDGTAYTPAGWKVTPVGVQRPAGFFPANAVLSPDGRAVLLPGVVRNHNNKQTVDVLDPATGNLLQEFQVDPDDKTKHEGVAPGLVFSHDGRTVYLATANKDAVLALAWDASARRLSPHGVFTLPAGAYPQTVAVSPDDKTVYAVGQYSSALYAVTVGTGAVSSAPTGPYPFGIALAGDGKTAYVSNQAGATVSVYSVDGPKLAAKGEVKVGTHPNFLLADAVRHRVFVSNGDSDTVSVIDTGRDIVTHTVSLAPYPGAHSGTSPSGLEISHDGKTLYVADSGNNAVAVVDVTSPRADEQPTAQTDQADQGSATRPDRRGFGRVRGLIPTGWYPTGVQESADGKRLLIANAKGLGTGPNKGGDPANPMNFPYIESQLQGYLQLVPTPDAKRLHEYTARVWDNNDFAARDHVRGTGHGMPATIVPRHPGQTSPIKHIIYVVKENRTFDQVLGDGGKGNADPSLAIFGRQITPNQHQLAARFATLDNYYTDGEVSQDGWNWATEANSNPFNQLATHQGYGGNGATYDSSGYVDSPVTVGNADPRRAYLWDAVAAHKLTFRHYGMQSLPAGWFGPKNKVKCPAGQYCTYEPLLNDNTDHAYPWFDMEITDQSRYAEWNKEFSGYVANGNLPTFEFIDLPRDHTSGFYGGGASAKAMVADNDQALGKIVDTVSHSKYWKDTAIFVTEDDAQDGPDHVDSHRSLGLVISPYTQRGIVDSHFYSQVSMLRTMELLTGMGPLTQYDAAAMPLLWTFGNKANLTPYTALTPAQSLTETNPPHTKSVVTPHDLLGRPDQAKADRLNQEIWRAVKGPHARMPAPKHNVYGRTAGDADG